MKRNISLLLLCVICLTTLIIPISAETDLPRIVDNAELLSEEEQNLLEDQVTKIRENYGMDVVILTVDWLNNKSAQDYADDYYDENGYGCGSNNSGVLFLISMKEREWYISTCGNAIYALTDYGIQQLGEVALSNLSSGDYFIAFSIYASELKYFFDAYESGHPIDGYADYSGDYYHGDQEQVIHYQSKPSIKLAVIIGLITSCVTVGIMAASMNTKRPKPNATDYLADNDFHLRRCEDIFLYSRVKKTRRSESSSSDGSSGGGSSVHTSSSGTSHGGGGGHF